MVKKNNKKKSKGTAARSGRVTSRCPAYLKASEFFNVGTCTSAKFVLWIKEHILKATTGYTHSNDEGEWHLLPTQTQLKKRKLSLLFTVYLKNDQGADDEDGEADTKVIENNNGKKEESKEDDAGGDEDGNGKKYIYLNFRRDDLYLVSYSFDLVSWFIFKDQASLQKNATNLKYDSSYGDLENNSRTKREHMIVGRNALEIAFDDLHRARTSSTDVVTKLEAKALLTFVIMFAEAMRFRFVMDLIHDNFDTCQTFGLYCKIIMNKWSSSSSAILKDMPLSNDQFLEDARNSIQVLKPI